MNKGQAIYLGFMFLLSVVVVYALASEEALNCLIKVIK